MRLEFSGGWELPHLDLASLRVEGRWLLGLCVFFFLLLLYLRRGDFRSLRGRRLALFLTLLVLTIPLNNVLWLRFPASDLLPPPAVPTAPPAPSVPLLGSLSIMFVAALFGAGPAMATGLVAGLARVGGADSRVFAPFELAAFGLVVGLSLHQAYRGRIWRLLRQPLMAGLLGAACRWVLLWFGVYAVTGGSSLSALEYTRSLVVASFGAVLLDGAIGGSVLQVLYAVVPGLKPPLSESLVPPHMRSMNRRLLTPLIPLTLLMAIPMFLAVTNAAIGEATNQAIDAMVQSATDAKTMIPLFFNTGQQLLRLFASNGQLLSSDAGVRQQILETNLRTGFYGPFFSQLIVVDQAGNPIGVYPESDPPPVLSLEEAELLQRTLNFGSPERSHVFATDNGHVISFSAPIKDGGGQPLGAVVGRSDLSVNPTVGNILAALEGPKDGDAGFVVDERGLVAFHPDADYLLQPRSIELPCADILASVEGTDGQAQGIACKDLASDGTQRLTFYAPIEAMGDWTVVATYPYELVLERATRVSGQLLVSLLLVIGFLAIMVAVLTRLLTRPLQTLATAARSIAEGQLDDQVALTGDDEVGQLGGAFEQMRLSLKGRLEDLSLLLRVSRVVSGSLDMTQGIPAILDVALQATDARFARLILFDEQGVPQFVIPNCEGGDNITALDRAMARLSRGDEPVMIENTAQARGIIDPRLVGPDVQALIAVPMRSKERDLGVMWLGYDHVHRFKDTEVDFLSTLTSQTAVAVENARLFSAAEGGRRRLAAILESTSDSVIVTDHADQVLLLNPAAAEVFGVDSQAASGMPITEVVQEERVLHLLTASMNHGISLTDEVPLPDGRTLYASASEIVADDGQTIGRVAVLRDITYLKELDEMKSEFVATVSHDLRAPLTFMRGYATMIPMAGEVSPKQKRYVDKIMVGIGQMTELIDDLLDLGRIEAGVGLKSEPCRLDEIIVTQVEEMQLQAKVHGLMLQLGRTEDDTVVIGDASLLRRVIANLVDNAIKYTPKGGKVTVSWETRGDRVLILVADTGIGIAKSDRVHLFEKFSRIQRRETINIKGSGLGLAIVKSIVERHKGRVGVESELGQGSTFFVELPVGGR